MAQPTWITPAGSLGVIPEGIFYSQILYGSTPLLPFSPTVTATTAANVITGQDAYVTCSSTEGVYSGLNVEFTGAVFGGLNDLVRYFVKEVLSPTTFSLSLQSPVEFPNVASVPLQTATGNCGTNFFQHIYYSVIAGQLPAGLQIAESGLIEGVPLAIASFQGVPFDVPRDVTSKFTLRAYTDKIVNNQRVVDGIRDRTFSLTVTGNNTPVWVTPPGSIGNYYDGGQVDFQFEYVDLDRLDTAVVTLIGGQLPPGLTLSSTGLLSGYIRPAAPTDQTPGYDETAAGAEPYDFVVAYISKFYQFTLQVSDGKSQDVRTFTMFVYARNELTADTTQITADNGIVTADESTERAPFLKNAVPSNLGTVRSSNQYAYEFLGDDYDTDEISYAISVNQGEGFPPGLTLDPKTGWLYGFIPDQGTTEVEYSFNITVYQTNTVGDPVICTSTSSTTNLITCVDTTPLAPPSKWYDIIANPDPLYVPIKLSGTALGGLTTADNTLYYVLYVYDQFTFSVTDKPNSTAPVNLTNTTGSMNAGVVVASQPYPFSLTITGAIDTEITWLSPSDLGTLVNGETSGLFVEAVNRGGRALQYRLASGEFNSLPQGLELLPSGEIAGTVTFNTFAIDLGDTTFDNNTTTWDSSFTFTVNAFAPDTQQTLYNVQSVVIDNPGTGYSSISPPTIVFSSPVGASAVTAQVGNVTITGGSITAIEIADPGAGYTDTATVTIAEGFGGTGAELSAVMQVTGTRDVVSVFKSFTIKVVRKYNKPYQNLFIKAMPPQSDRQLLNQLLSNREIFVPEFIYRPTDPNFGVATEVSYLHAVGLNPEVLSRYVESLYLNHYWKNLTLGQVEVAQALDSNGVPVYEVVYSRIIDNLVNNEGQSVSRIVPLPYPIIDPNDGSTVIGVVYPNSLVNMRDQVIDTVGQESNVLPLWMTSKQENGRVLGFTPAWVMAYVKPGRGKQIAYYLNQQFGQQLNKIDFKVDRYILDRALSLHWDPETQDWTPQPSLTTFDRFNTSGFNFVGTVNFATRLAYSDVNQRTIDYIKLLGGLDGQVQIRSGTTLVFVKQENYNGPPGSQYSTTDQGWQDAQVLYDGGPYDANNQEFDQGFIISGGEVLDCISTSSANNRITYVNTTGSPKVYPGLPLNIASPIGGLGTGLHVVFAAPTNTTFTVCKATFVNTVEGTTDLVTISDSTGFAVGDRVVFYQTTFGGIVENQTYFIRTLTPLTGTQAQITLSLTPGGTRVDLVSATGTCIMRGDQLSLTTDAGAMEATTFNERMAIFRIDLDPVSQLVSLTLVDQTATYDYVQVLEGSQYASAQLYRPLVPGTDLTRISWLPLQAVPQTETTFDQDSMQFIEPVDMYNGGQENNKYLVFPKSNILV